MNDETELIARSRQGHSEAFAELVLLHQGRVRAFLGQYFRNPDMVDDLAQEVFLAAFRTLDTYNADLPLGPWLLGIARNRALNALRNEARRKVRETRSWRAELAAWKADGLEQTPQAADPSPEIQYLERCLQKLPEQSARLVTEFYFKARPAAEIARQSGKRESGIRMTLLRIRQALRQCIQEQRMAVQEK